MQRRCLHCGERFVARNSTAKTCSVRCRVARHRGSSRDSPRARHAAAEALILAYTARFGRAGMYGMYGPAGLGEDDLPADLPAMRKALRTGIDGLLAKRERQLSFEARNVAEHAAEIEAEHAAPFTPEREREFTGRIKARELRSGDCERPWQNYFSYRDARPALVEALTDDDMRYVGQWTSCGLPIKPGGRDARED